jgi:hypothetical protein
MGINLKRSRQYLQDFDFSSLFIEELGWSNPPSDSAIAFKCDGKTFYHKGVADSTLNRLCKRLVKFAKINRN